MSGSFIGSFAVDTYGLSTKGKIQIFLQGQRTQHLQMTINSVEPSAPFSRLTLVAGLVERNYLYENTL
jgi:hypothetical protein